MTDIADLAAEIEAEHLAVSLSQVARTIPAGVAGICDECEEHVPRLVEGRCGFCRDGRCPPPSFYASRDARSPIPSPAEEHVPMAVKQPVILNRKITIEGPALAAVERRAASGDMSFKQAAAELIEDAVAPAQQAAPIQSSPAGVLSICDVDDLLDELRDRFNAAASRRDLEDDLRAALSRAENAEDLLRLMAVRAEQAETRLSAIRAQVLEA